MRVTPTENSTYWVRPDTERSLTVVDDLGDLSSSDVEFVCGKDSRSNKVPLCSSKCILSRSSDFLAKAFDCPCSGCTYRIWMPDFDAKVVERVLELLHCGVTDAFPEPIDTQVEHLMQMQNVCIHLRLKSLLEVVSDALKSLGQDTSNLGLGVAWKSPSLQLESQQNRQASSSKSKRCFVCKQERVEIMGHLVSVHFKDKIKEKFNVTSNECNKCGISYGKRSTYFAHLARQHFALNDVIPDHLKSYYGFTKDGRTEGTRRNPEVPTQRKFKSKRQERPEEAVGSGPLSDSDIETIAGKAEISGENSSGSNPGSSESGEVQTTGCPQTRTEKSSSSSSFSSSELESAEEGKTEVSDCSPTVSSKRLSLSSSSTEASPTKVVNVQVSARCTTGSAQSSSRMEVSPTQAIQPQVSGRKATGSKRSSSSISSTPPEDEPKASGKRSSSHPTKFEWKCHKCDRRWPSYRKLISHLARFHFRSNLFKKFKVDKKMPKVCPKCGSRFLRVGQLAIHLATKYRGLHGLLPKLAEFKVELVTNATSSLSTSSAGSSLYSSSSKNQASDQKEGLVERYECHICSKLFLQYKELLKHYSKTHYFVKLCSWYNDDVTTCEICKASFKRNNNFLFHMVYFHDILHRFLPDKNQLLKLVDPTRSTTPDRSDSNELNLSESSDSKGESSSSSTSETSTTQSNLSDVKHEGEDVEPNFNEELLNVSSPIVTDNHDLLFSDEEMVAIENALSPILPTLFRCDTNPENQENLAVSTEVSRGVSETFELEDTLMRF